MSADGAATLGTLGTSTAQQKTVRKLSILCGQVVVGGSGHAGLAQRLRSVIEQEYESQRLTGRPEHVVGLLRTSLLNVVEPEFAAALVAARVVGNHAAASAISNTLVAIPINGRAELVQFDQQCAPELATDDLPFVALGMGRYIADPFLAFVRRTLWQKTVPTIEDGVFSAVWTLQHAIDTNTGGVAEPIQVVVLRREGNVWTAMELTDAELAQHREGVRSAEGALRAWRSEFGASPDATAPEGPPL